MFLYNTIVLTYFHNLTICVNSTIVTFYDLCWESTGQRVILNKKEVKFMVTNTAHFLAEKIQKYFEEKQSLKKKHWNLNMVLAYDAIKVLIALEKQGYIKIIRKEKSRPKAFRMEL